MFILFQLEPVHVDLFHVCEEGASFLAVCTGLKLGKSVVGPSSSAMEISIQIICL